MNPTRLAEIRATQARADALVAAAQTDATDMSWVIANVDAIAELKVELVRAVPELLAEVDSLRAVIQPFADYWRDYLAFRKEQYWYHMSFQEWIMHTYGGVDELLYAKGFAVLNELKDGS